MRPSTDRRRMRCTTVSGRGCRRNSRPGEHRRVAGGWLVTEPRRAGFARRAVWLPEGEGASRNGACDVRFVTGIALSRPGSLLFRAMRLGPLDFGPTLVSINASHGVLCRGCRQLVHELPIFAWNSHAEILGPVAFAAKTASTSASPRGACRVLGHKLPGLAWNPLLRERTLAHTQRPGRDLHRSVSQAFCSKDDRARSLREAGTPGIYAACRGDSACRHAVQPR